MWGRNPAAQPVPDKVTTVLGRGMSFNGQITGEGSLRVDGRFEGELRVSGDVYVGEGATVRAQIWARNVTIAGEVQGDVQAEERLELSRTGRLYGDLRARVLTIAEGALFEGRSHVLEQAEAPEPDGRLRVGLEA